jgi:hypothetical protein
MNRRGADQKNKIKIIPLLRFFSIMRALCSKRKKIDDFCTRRANLTDDGLTIREAVTYGESFSPKTIHFFFFVLL